MKTAKASCEGAGTENPLSADTSFKGEVWGNAQTSVKGLKNALESNMKRKLIPTGADAQK